MELAIEEALKRYGREKPDRLNKFIKEEMSDLANVFWQAAWEWMQDEYSNMSPSDIEAQLDAIWKVHRETLTSWVREHYDAYPTRHACPDPGECEIEIREA